jgi:hypothetical protein
MEANLTNCYAGRRQTAGYASRRREKSETPQPRVLVAPRIEEGYGGGGERATQRPPAQAPRPGQSAAGLVCRPVRGEISSTWGGSCGREARRGS